MYIHLQTTKKKRYTFEQILTSALERDTDAETYLTKVGIIAIIKTTKQKQVQTLRNPQTVLFNYNYTCR